MHSMGNYYGSGSVQDILLYTGAETEVTADRTLGLSGAIVQTLVEPYLDKNHVLFVDNWYTSPDLFDFLLSRQTGACGTVRRDRRNLPFVEALKDKGDVVHRKANNILFVVWKDKREVSLLSTIHNPVSVLSQNVDPHSRQRIMKPECVLDYNQNMRLVDKSDAMISSIECARKTLKWYKKLFFHLLDLTMLNSYILYTLKSGKKGKLQSFIIEVIRQLLETNATERPAPGHRSASLDPSRLTARHFPRTMQPPPESKKQRVQRACYVCRHTTRRQQQRRDTRYHCRECDVALCIEPCFEEYHTVQNF